MALRIDPQGFPDRGPRGPSFPTRTLVLMLLALGAFGWMYWQTHGRARPGPAPLSARSVAITIEPLTDAGAP